jgi:hypothetical protein
MKNHVSNKDIIDKWVAAFNEGNAELTNVIENLFEDT